MNDPLAEIRHRRTGSTAIIEAPENFDVYIAPRVRGLAIALQRDGVTRIVFDLAVVVFMDNTALGVIAATHNRLQSSTGSAAIAAAAGPVARLFQATGLTKILPMFATCQEAVSFLRARAGETGAPA